jgi:hypothetical protein
MAVPAKLFRIIVFNVFILYCNSLTTSILQYYFYDVITFIHHRPRHHPTSSFSHFSLLKMCSESAVRPFLRQQTFFNFLVFFSCHTIN